MSAKHLLRIGEVHALLRLEFPELELSKIRYYEDQGLVEPSRSRKGYRLYTNENVECLRLAIRLATNEFLPLRVIRGRLIDQGLIKSDSPTPQVRTAAKAARDTMSMSVTAPVPAPEMLSESPSLRIVSEDTPLTPTITTVSTGVTSVTVPSKMNRSQFLQETGIIEAQLVELEAVGVIAPSSAARELVYAGSDVAIIDALRPLLARGVDIRVLGSLRRSVEREIGIIDDLQRTCSVEGSLTPDDVRQNAQEAATAVAAVRHVLAERLLGDYLGN
jgi:DNA-binding transcriptional MerR regulator